MPEQNHRTESTPDPGGRVAEDSLADLATDVVAGSAREPGSVDVLVGTERVRIVLAGEVDIDLERELREAVASAEKTHKPIDVDAHHVSFIDSSGVSLLAELASRANPPVRVLRAPPSVRFLLSVTRIDEIVELLDEDPGLR